ncbi:IclR family transcriptional regulator [Paracoccus pacificus]|uniref:IclR family transcriptional regulator n=1 Tax=Paracoccus pacificus TaxID=1463598 RepID=A0ABW4R609_9RHOB
MEADHALTQSAAQTVRAADMSLRILQHVAFADVPQGVTQIASAVGIAKGAAYKHLRTLLDHGMLVQDPLTSHYRLGPKLWLMGQRAPQGQAMSEISQPLMRKVRDELGLAVVLSSPTKSSAFVLATFSSNQAIDIGVKPGSNLQLHCSAQGKIFLAYDAHLRESLKDPLPRVTANTITDRSALMAELEQIRRQGYAVAPEEVLLGINALAAPIFDRSGALVGSIGLIGSIGQLGAVPTERQLTLLRELTQTISKRL